MTDWFDIAKEVTTVSNMEEIRPEEAYQWRLFCIVDDIKEALELVPMEQLIRDLEKRGIDFRGWN